ncbi:MAG: aspartate/glutamate racemase family protein, partial [Spirochaetaceae bacterium]|nr:aspartate/glutamate racemase family protein [Spirochaetaceae bacterium]
MIDSSIAFIDSGIGGLPYLDWIRCRRPDLPVTYLADTAHFPYGDMKSEDVRIAVVGAVRRLLRAGTPRLLTVACNTASVTALEEIRAITPCPVVGTVPALKSAAGLPIDGPIGVLATSGTVESPYLDRLVSAFAGGRKVIRVAAGDIVRFVEERWLDEGDSGAVPVMERALDTL